MKFLEEYKNLQQTCPHPSNFNGQFSENIIHSEYTHRSSSCVYCYNSTSLESGIYCTKCVGKFIVDCDNCIWCELLYESVDCNYCYESSFLVESNSCRNCSHCIRCDNCSNCFGCVGLSHKKFCIFNKQYDKLEYEKKLRDIENKNISQHLQNLIDKTPSPSKIQINSINCPYGNYIRSSKNSYWCFNTLEIENSGYIIDGGIAKNCWDMTFSGIGSENCYEMVGCSECYNCAFLLQSRECSYCYFGTAILNCKHCFGCVEISHKSYCILNRQYNKDEYFRTVKMIKEELNWPSSNADE